MEFLADAHDGIRPEHSSHILSIFGVLAFNEASADVLSDLVLCVARDSS